LTVKASVPDPFSEEQRKNTTFLAREFIWSIAFPKDVNGDAIDASYDQGVLTLEIPLAEHAQRRRIGVRAGEQKSAQTEKAKLS
jgi:HSP20 family molecular chaperone IbpA